METILQKENLSIRGFAAFGVLLFIGLTAFPSVCAHSPAFYPCRHFPDVVCFAFERCWAGGWGIYAGRVHVSGFTGLQVFTGLGSGSLYFGPTGDT